MARKVLATLELNGPITGPATATIFNTVSTTINAFGSATALTIGSSASGTKTLTLQSGANNGTNTINIGTGSVSTGTIAINIGTATISSGAVTNTIGSASSTTTINGTLNAALGKKVIQTATLSGTSAISFTSIPAGYRDLEIRILATTAVSTSGTLTLTVNGLTTNIYNTVHQYVNGVSPSSITYAQQQSATSANLTASTFGATASSALTYTLRDYTSGSFKVGNITWMGGPSSGTYFHGTGGLFIKTTAAITQIDIAVGGTGGITGSAVLIGVY